jgi:hypothetical protein
MTHKGDVTGAGRCPPEGRDGRRTREHITFAGEDQALHLEDWQDIRLVGDVGASATTIRHPPM